MAGADALSRCEFARLVAGERVRCTTSTEAGVTRPLDCTLDSSRARTLLRTRLRGAQGRARLMLGGQLRRLARHSAIYGLGGIVSRILAVLLLPLYTRYLAPEDYGEIETLLALSAVLVIVLRAGISSAFFRFYFDSPDPARRVVVVRTSFWFTMASATFGLVAGLLLAEPISNGSPRRATARTSSAPRSSGSGRR